jgi:hypothetical protein
MTRETATSKLDCLNDTARGIDDLQGPAMLGLVGQVGSLSLNLSDQFGDDIRDQVGWDINPFEVPHALLPLDEVEIVAGHSLVRAEIQIVAACCEATHYHVGDPMQSGAKLTANWGERGA